MAHINVNMKVSYLDSLHAPPFQFHGLGIMFGPLHSLQNMSTSNFVWQATSKRLPYLSYQLLI